MPELLHYLVFLGEGNHHIRSIEFLRVEEMNTKICEFPNTCPSKQGASCSISSETETRGVMYLRTSSYSDKK